LPRLIEMGVRIALGTDSRASNPDLDLLAEMRHVAEEFPSIDPQRIWRMGTLSAAEALGRDAELGSITPGKFANLVAIPIPKHGATAPDETLSAILAGSQRPSDVWFHGLDAADWFN
jgi:imidazolonepropionase-like amidohydrolase